MSTLAPFLFKNKKIILVICSKYYSENQLQIREGSQLLLSILMKIDSLSKTLSDIAIQSNLKINKSPFIKDVMFLVSFQMRNK